MKTKFWLLALAFAVAALAIWPVFERGSGIPPTAALAASRSETAAMPAVPGGGQFLVVNGQVAIIPDRNWKLSRRGVELQVIRDTIDGYQATLKGQSLEVAKLNYLSTLVREELRHDQIVSYLDEFSTMLGERSWESLSSVIGSALAEDNAVFLQLARSREPQGYHGMISKSWALAMIARDPAGALALFRGELPPRWANECSLTALPAFAERNLDDALGLIEKINPSLSTLQQTARRAMSAQAPDSVIESISKDPRWGKVSRGPLLDAAFEQIATDDPTKAVELLSGVKSDRASAIQGLVVGWSGHQPSEASEWLNKVPAGEDRDSGVLALVGSIYQNNPQEALEWALTLGQTPQLVDTLQMVYRTWVLRDPQGAWNFVSSKELPPDVLLRVTGKNGDLKSGNQ